MIKQRDFWAFVCLSIITCGIYSIFFFYSMNEDINKMCRDGEETPDYLLVLLFSILTCGIYGIYWQYKEAERLNRNAHKFGLSFEENGVTILLWILIGSFLCGLGSLVATYLLIKNTNAMAAAYNGGQGGYDYQTVN